MVKFNQPKYHSDVNLFVGIRTHHQTSNRKFLYGRVANRIYLVVACFRMQKAKRD